MGAKTAAQDLGMTGDALARGMDSLRYFVDGLGYARMAILELPDSKDAQLAYVPRSQVCVCSCLVFGVKHLCIQLCVACLFVLL